MADLLREADGLGPVERSAEPAIVPVQQPPREKRLQKKRTTPGKSTPVKNTGVALREEEGRKGVALPQMDVFLDEILPRFPAAQQAILLRLYRWSEGREKSLVVSTPRLAAKTNMDEKSCRKHLQALVGDGYLVRSMDGSHDARFGGGDRQARGLLLHLSAEALAELAN